MRTNVVRQGDFIGDDSTYIGLGKHTDFGVIGGGRYQHVFDVLVIHQHHRIKNTGVMRHKMGGFDVFAKAFDALVHQLLTLGGGVAVVVVLTA